MHSHVWVSHIATFDDDKLQNFPRNRLQGTDRQIDMSNKNSQPRNNITTEDWFIYFKSVLEKEIDANEE